MKKSDENIKGAVKVKQLVSQVLKINDDILENKRAEYGKQIIELLSKQLTEEYGAGWSKKQIRHCLLSAETFWNFKIVVSLIRQLSWTHFIESKNLIDIRCNDE